MAMESNTYVLATIVAYPLVGSVCGYLLGRTRPGASGWVASGCSFMAFLYAVVAALFLPAEGAVEDRLFTWFALGGLDIPFTLRIDRLSAVMCLVVTGVGSLIHLYAIGYMAHDYSRPRFFAYFNLFMFAMLLLVLAGNLPLLFIGWEGVGLCSYLLIGFWHKNPAFAAAGRKAFIVNRIGDAGFLLGMLLLFTELGTLDFADLSQKIGPANLEVGLLTLIALCFFVGATGKSAQIPLFVWLPDAMAGPTPVSALIHAATMVTAGVYLLARLHFLFALAPYALFVVVVVAVLTAFMAASIALMQFDIKKVLAYSTISQLGFMFMAAGAGAYAVAIFHVVTHAFFKACLFLGAGSVIHGCHHEQDMRRLGGLMRRMPWTAGTYLGAVLAIAGIFPLAGYQSKHAILQALHSCSNPFLQGSLQILLGVASFTAVLTAFYMTRSFALTFLGEYRGEGTPHESPWVMVVPLVVLALLSVCGGLVLHQALPAYLMSWGPGHLGEAESIPVAIFHSWPGILGVSAAFLVYTQFTWLPERCYFATRPVSTLLRGKYYIDEIYQVLIVQPLEHGAKVLWRVLDQGVIDGTVNGSAAVVDTCGEVVRWWQTGRVGQYALFMFVGLVLILACCFLG